MTTSTVRESELVAFVLIRITALVLAVLVLGHFAVTHLVNDVAETDATFVLERWSTGLWIAWDSAMLVAALTHAGCGLWLMLDQGVADLRRRQQLRVGMTAVLVGLAVLGVAAVGIGAQRS